MEKLQIKKQTLIIILMFTLLFGIIGTNNVFASEVSSQMETEIEEHQHEFQLIKTIEATCKNDGYKEYKCITCDELKQVKLLIKEHSFIHYKTQASTCTKTGLKYWKCEGCGKTKTTKIAKKLHSYTKYIKTVKSTCKTTGYKLYQCTSCTSTTKVTLDKTKHTYTNYSTKASTCTKTGTKYWKCKVCGVKKTTTISKKEHTYKYVKTVKPTYSKTGYKLYKCSKCGTTKKTTIAKLQTVSFNTTGLKAPTKSDFGKYYNDAYAIYKNFLNKSESYVEIVFDSEKDRKNFEAMLDSKIILNSSIHEIVVNRGSRDGKIRGAYRAEKSNYTYVKETINYAYSACKKAGVKNGMAQKTAVKKINTWICKNMTYKITNGDALSGFKNKKGQCMTYAQMFEVMCETAGIQTDYVRGTGGGGSHAWNRVKIDGKWYWVDSTWNDSGSKSNDKYLLDTSLWKSHKVK